MDIKPIAKLLVVKTQAEDRVQVAYETPPAAAFTTGRYAHLIS